MRLTRTLVVSLLGMPLLAQQFRPGFARDVLGQSPFRTLGAPVAADLDNDGLPDLVFGDPDFTVSAQDRILRNALSRFEHVPAASLPLLGSGPATPIDIDGDGDLDLAFCSSPARLLRNQGGMSFADGSAGLPQFFSQGAGEAFDVDGDGDQDLVLPWGRVLVNDGNGIFTDETATRWLAPPSTFNIGLELLAADFDGDGDADVVVMNGLYRNDGTGVFTLDAAAGIAFGYRNIPFLLDVEGDGDSDVLLTSGHLFVNDGSGIFAAPAQALPPAVVAGGGGVVGVGQVDGNAGPDVIVGRSPSQAPSWIANDGAGAFPQANVRSLPLRTHSITDVALADLDGDGDADLVSVNKSEHRPTAAEVLYNDGLGNWLSATEPADSFAPRTSDHAVVDVDGDGDLDLLSHVHVGRNDGNGELVTVALPHPATAFAHADFDGDGVLDLVGNRGEIWRGTGNLQFVAGPALFPAGTWMQWARVLDLDGDGDVDLLTQTWSPTWSAWLNNGAAQFTQALPGTFGLPSAPPRSMVTGDFNGDGRGDVMTVPAAVFPVGQLTQLRNTGSGSFSAVPMPVTPWEIHGMRAVDIDGDGDLDVIAESPNIAMLFVNDGTGAFTTRQLVGLHGYGLRPDDVDLDGDVDLWVQHNGSYAVAVNDGTNQFAVDVTRVSTDISPHGVVDVVMLDLDRDGDRDALVIAQNFHTQWHEQAVLWNHVRHLRASTMARPGGALELELSAARAVPTPTAALFAVSTVALSIPVADLGVLGLDPSQGVMWLAGFAGESVTSSLPIPAVAGLRGLGLYAQALLVSPTSLRLTNTVRTVIID